MKFKFSPGITFIIILGFALYANTLPNEMFWDDEDFILNNSFIKDWRYFPQYFEENVIAGSGLVSNYWRPMLLTVFAAEWHIFGAWRPGYHIVNTAFHIADAIILFFLLNLIFGKRTPAFLAALFFLTHPLQTEAVTMAAGLGDSLSVFFILFGLYFYAKFPERKSLSLGAYILALMSKETAIIMPALIFLIDLFSGKEKDSPLWERVMKTGARLLPFILTAVVYITLRATLLNFKNTFNFYDDGGIFASSYLIRLFTFFRVLTVYFGLLFLPFELHMERDVEIAENFFSPSVIFGGLASLILISLALFSLRSFRWRMIGFGILWFFITLFPTSNILVPINSVIYEHWLYLPLAGFYFGIVGIWIGIAEKLRLNPATRKSFIGAFILLIAFFAVLTIRRNRDWRDPITFYTKTLKHAPASYRVLNNLGKAYAEKESDKEAEAAYKKAVGLQPDNPVAHHNLGNLYKAEGKNELAVYHFRKALEADPKFIFSSNALRGLGETLVKP